MSDDDADAKSRDDETVKAYRLCFHSPAGQAVLADLASFCFAAKPTFDPDPRVHAFNDGCRSVWLKIQWLIQLTEEDILQLALGRKRLKEGDSNDG